MYTDFLFLLSPPENIKHEITRYKKASAKHIGEFASVNSPAHISINQLERQKPFMVENGLTQIEKQLYAMPPILLHLDGFKYFTYLHSKYTIYAYIRSTPAVEDWLKLLRTNLNIKKAFVPHITVVRNIPEWDYKKLWPHFQHKKLLEPFWINEIKVLQRETFGGSQKWEAFKNFKFNGNGGLMEVVQKDESVKRLF